MENQSIDPTFGEKALTLKESIFMMRHGFKIKTPGLNGYLMLTGGSLIDTHDEIIPKKRVFGLVTHFDWDHEEQPFNFEGFAKDQNGEDRKFFLANL